MYLELIVEVQDLCGVEWMMLFSEGLPNTAKLILLDSLLQEESGSI